MAEITPGKQYSNKQKYSLSANTVGRQNSAETSTRTNYVVFKVHNRGNWKYVTNNASAYGIP